MTSSENIALVDALDKILDKGVIVLGDLTISVANVDLVYAGLKLMLASVETAERMRDAANEPVELINHSAVPQLHTSQPKNSDNDSIFSPKLPKDNIVQATNDMNTLPKKESLYPTLKPISEKPKNRSTVKNHSTHQTTEQQTAKQINFDPDGVEKGLAQLVMTIIELLRQLMEKQAMRRMDGGSLTDEEIERLGLTFMRLEERMADLKEIFKLTDDDLNFDLGPLGKLL